MKLPATVIGLLQAVLVVCGSFAGTAHAEVSELRMAQQWGINYLQLMVIQDRQLIKKYAKTEGLDHLKVTWAKFGSGSVMNDALLSGSLHFASGGVGPLITLWAKTRGNLDVKGVSSLDSMPVVLNTRNSNIKTLKDFTDKDKIALPAVKVSIQAVTLEMAAAQAFGDAHYDKLDRLTVSMSHPDGVVALLSGGGEVDAHFTGPPFNYEELRHPGIHTVVNSYDVLGGKTTSTLVWTTSKFRKENPKVYRAVFRALQNATQIINHDKRGAAKLYLRISKSKDTIEHIMEVMNDPDIEFTLTPMNVTKYADFMYKVGSIKHKPASWKDMFFPEIYNLPGS